MIIGKKIKERRIELKMSQRELSDRMGYSNHSTITRIESGKVDIPQSKIAKFAEVLNTTPAYLMGWMDEIEEKPVETANKLADLLMRIEVKEIEDLGFMTMIEEYTKLPDTKKAQVREYVHLLARKD